MESMLCSVESCMDSDPKWSFQILASWYKCCSGVNFPLAKCEMTELETEYAALYQVVPSEVEPLRVDLGEGFGIPNDIPNEEEIRNALGPMRRGKAQPWDHPDIGLTCSKHGAQHMRRVNPFALEKGGYTIPVAVFEGPVNWMLAVVMMQDIFSTGMVP